MATSIMFGTLKRDPETEAVHYGVAGQRWGFRKATTRGGTPPSKRKATETVDLVDNKSGTRTPINYNPKKTKLTLDSNNNVVGIQSKSRKANAEIQKQIDKADSQHKTQAMKSMSNAELRERNERIRLEQEYAKLTTPQQKAESVVTSVLKQSGKAIAGQVLTQLGTAYISNAVGVNLNKALPEAYRVSGGKKK